MGNKAEPWRYANGPAQAYLLTLARLSWAPKGGAAILLDDQRTVDLRHVPPAALVAELRAAVDRWSWRKAARALECPRLSTGGLLVGHQKLLSARSTLDKEQKNSLIAVVAVAAQSRYWRPTAVLGLASP